MIEHSGESGALINAAKRLNSPVKVQEASRDKGIARIMAEGGGGRTCHPGGGPEEETITKG